MNDPLGSSRASPKLDVARSSAGDAGTASITSVESVDDFEAFYRSNRARLITTLSAVTRCDADSATEAVDEGFVRALARWNRVARMDAPAGWVFTVARNQLRRTATRRTTERRVVTSAASARPIDPVHHDPQPELWDAVANLPDRERLAVALRYIADLTERQVAEVMRVSPGTVAATLHAARQTLAGQLNSSRGEEREVKE